MRWIKLYSFLCLFCSSFVIYGQTDSTNILTMAEYLSILKTYHPVAKQADILTVTRTQKSRSITGSVFQYSPKPPKIPTNILSVLLRYRRFCDIASDIGIIIEINYKDSSAQIVARYCLNSTI